MFKSFIESLQKPIIIDGYDTGYIIESSGNVYKVLDDGSYKYIKPCICSHGYLAVTLYFNEHSNQYLLHRLVALAFIPNPENKPVVNHKDGDKTNDDWLNLEWVSHKENMIHALKTGLHPVDTHKRVYSDEQIHEICKLLEENKLTYKEIANKVGVNYTLIRDLKFRGKHRSITSQYNINKKHVGYKTLRNDVFKLMEKGLSNSDIFKMLNIKEADKRHIEYCRYLFNKKNNQKQNGRYQRVDHINTDKVA